MRLCFSAIITAIPPQATLVKQATIHFLHPALLIVGMWWWWSGRLTGTVSQGLVLFHGSGGGMWPPPLPLVTAHALPPRHSPALVLPTHARTHLQYSQGHENERKWANSLRTHRSNLDYIYINTTITTAPYIYLVMLCLWLC